MTRLFLTSVSMTSLLASSVVASPYADLQDSEFKGFVAVSPPRDFPLADRVAALACEQLALDAQERGARHHPERSGYRAASEAGLEGTLLGEMTEDKFVQFAELAAGIYSVASLREEVEQEEAPRHAIQQRLDVLDTQIEHKQQSIDALDNESKKAATTLCPPNTGFFKPFRIKRKKQRASEAYLLGLESTHGCRLPGHYKKTGLTVEEVNIAVQKRKSDLQAELRDFQAERDLLTNKNMRAVQAWLSSVASLSHLKAVGVFERNDGEFSGAVIYDEAANEVFITAAGSKSVADWGSNLKGWNGESNRAGLEGMRFHSGFLSHFQSIKQGSLEAVNSWLEDMKKKQDAGEVGQLKIRGVGHSLGGAITEMMTAYVRSSAETHGVDCHVGGVGFGVPNGQSNVAAFHERIGGPRNWIQVRRSYDPVTGIVAWKDKPGVSMQTKGTYWYDAHDNFMPFGGILLGGHSSEAYRAAARVSFPHMIETWKQEAADWARYSLYKAAHDERRGTLQAELAVEIIEGTAAAKALAATGDEADAQAAAELKKTLAHAKKVLPKKGWARVKAGARSLGRKVASPFKAVGSFFKRCFS